MSTEHAEATVEVRLNGQHRRVPPSTSIGALVDAQWGRAVAVARNGEVVPRADWDVVHVEPGDEIEIVRPIQGGA